jgi:hypothetical protein
MIVTAAETIRGRRPGLMRLIRRLPLCPIWKVFPVRLRFFFDILYLPLEYREEDQPWQGR